MTKILYAAMGKIIVVEQRSPQVNGGGVIISNFPSGFLTALCANMELSSFSLISRFLNQQLCFSIGYWA